jgi:hypothetical protein
MDTGNMTFEEIIFNGRYHIIGAVMFLVFVAAFAREVIRELAATVAERRRVAHRHSMGVFGPDMMLGATMTDGGEPVEQDKKQNDETSSPQD